MHKSPRGFRNAIEKSSAGSIICEPRRNARVISCIVNATPSGADRLAAMIVYVAQVEDVDLRGWRITLVTPDDYVVTRAF